MQTNEGHHLWTRSLVSLCLYGLFKEFQPLEPFLTPYLKGFGKNFTEEEVDNEIYPVWTYSSLSSLVLVFLVTDLVRYKPVIIFEALTCIATCLMLIFGKTVLTMQFMQFTFGLASATEIAYYTYIYATTDDALYQKVTSYTRAAVLSGRLLGGIIGQILVSVASVSYYELNFISLSSVGVAFLVSVSLPSVKKGKERITLESKDMPTSDGPSIQDINGEPSLNDEICSAEDESKNVRDIEDNPPRECNCFRPVLAYLKQLKDDFVGCYSDFDLLKWSMWWALATCGYFQVGNYGRNLWDVISPSRHNNHVYNGAVEAFSIGLGAISAFSIGYCSVNWEIFGELLLGIVSLLDAALLIISSQTKSIWLAYALYALFRSTYQLAITIASFQIASKLKTNNYGLVFGWNMFIALLLQTILTSIVVDDKGLDTPVRIQFIVYGVYFLLIAILFLIKATWSFTARGCKASWQQRYRNFSEKI